MFSVMMVTEEPANRQFCRCHLYRGIRAIAKLWSIGPKVIGSMSGTVSHHMG